MSEIETEKIEQLKIYADPACTKPIDSIAWLNAEKINVVKKDGSVEIHDSIREGESATAECWIKNHSPYDFGVTKILSSNPNIQVFLTESTIYPQRPVKLTLLAMAKEGAYIGEPLIGIKGYYIKKKVIQ